MDRIFSANMVNNSKPIAAVTGLKLGDEKNLTVCTSFYLPFNKVMEHSDHEIFSHTELKITGHDISSNEYHRVLRFPGP